MDKLLGSKVDAYWFDPASGIYSYFGALDCRGVEEFVPPVKPAGHNDWVLVLRNR